MTTSPVDAESASRNPAGQLHSRAIAVSHLVSRLLAAPNLRIRCWHRCLPTCRPITLSGWQPGWERSSADDDPPMVLPAPDEPVPFELHIKSLFRRHDRQSVTFAFDLWDYQNVKDHGEEILHRRSTDRCPATGPASGLRPSGDGSSPEFRRSATSRNMTLP